MVLARGTIDRSNATFFTRLALATMLAVPASSPPAKNTHTLRPVSRNAA